MRIVNLANRTQLAYPTKHHSLNDIYGTSEYGAQEDAGGERREARRAAEAAERRAVFDANDNDEGWASYG